MLNKIFNGPYLRRLDNTIQWQEKDTLASESVSSHSFKVAVFARLLLEDLFGKCLSTKINDFKLNVITAALFHDFDEAILMRDISHELKYNRYNGNKIREVLNNYVSHVVEKDFTSRLVIEENQHKSFYQDSAKMLSSAVLCEDEAVKTFVKYCDWLALLFYCKREIDLNNQNFKSIIKYCEEMTLDAGSKLRNVLAKTFANDGICIDFENTNLFLNL